jgi:hypothetical protein
MYDDKPQPPKTCPPVDPPPGFESWQSWLKAGCPTLPELIKKFKLDDQVEGAPTPKVYRSPAEVPPPPSVRQLELGAYGAQGSGRDFFGKRTSGRRKKPTPA